MSLLNNTSFSLLGVLLAYSLRCSVTILIEFFNCSSFFILQSLVAVELVGKTLDNSVTSLTWSRNLGQQHGRPA